MAIYNGTVSNGDLGSVAWANGIYGNTINTTDDIHGQYSLSVCSGDAKATDLVTGTFIHKLDAVDYEIVFFVQSDNINQCNLTILDEDNTAYYSNQNMGNTANVGGSVYFLRADVTLTGATANKATFVSVNLGGAGTVTYHSFNLSKKITVAS